MNFPPIPPPIKCKDIPTGAVLFVERTDWELYYRNAISREELLRRCGVITNIKPDNQPKLEDHLL